MAEDKHKIKDENGITIGFKGCDSGCCGQMPVPWDELIQESARDGVKKICNDALWRMDQKKTNVIKAEMKNSKLCDDPQFANIRLVSLTLHYTYKAAMDDDVEITFTHPMSEEDFKSLIGEK